MAGTDLDVLIFNSDDPYLDLQMFIGRWLETVNEARTVLRRY